MPITKEAFELMSRLVLVSGRIQAMAFAEARPMQEITELVQLADACTRVAKHMLHAADGGH